MTVETATFISQLDQSKPPGSDFKAEGDDHLRLVKTTLKNSFPNFGTVVACNATATEMNFLVGVTELIQPVLTQVPLKSPIDSPTFTGIARADTAPPGTNTTQLATTEFVQVAIADSDVGLKYQLSCSDLTSDLVANPQAAYFRAQSPIAVTEVRASLLTASSSGAVTVRITVNGANLFTGLLQIDQGEKTSLTAASTPSLLLTTIPDDAEVVIEIVSPGVGAKGLIVSIKGSV